MVEGGCLCGKVRYQVDGFRGGAAHCHCSMCRKMHGAAFGTYARVVPEGFRWLQGEDHVQFYRSSEHALRTFCRHCGSTLQMIFEHESGEIIDIALGTVDGDPDIRPQSHIFVGSKAPWYTITDDLPQRQEWK